jgi:hypothetical protein
MGARMWVTEVIFGKASANTAVKPLFIDVLIARILRKPSVVKCSFALINSTTIFKAERGAVQNILVFGLIKSTFFL